MPDTKTCWKDSTAPMTSEKDIPDAEPTHATAPGRNGPHHVNDTHNNDTRVDDAPKGLGQASQASTSTLSPNQHLATNSFTKGVGPTNPSRALGCLESAATPAEHPTPAEVATGNQADGDGIEAIEAIAAYSTKPAEYKALANALNREGRRKDALKAIRAMRAVAAFRASSRPAVQVRP